MLLCDTCGSQGRDAEDLAVFVAQLAALGAEARVHVRTVPAGLGRNVQFDLAPFLVDRPLGPDDRMLLIGGHRLTDDRLMAFRRLAEPPVPCHVFGAFATRQAAIGARAKLAYVFGVEPEMHDLGTGQTGPADQLGGGTSGPVFGIARPPVPASRPRVLLVAPDLAEGRDGASVTAMALSRRYQLSVLTDGRSKSEWQAVHGTELPLFQYGEILPADLAGRVDVAICLAPADGNYRLQCLLANLALSGAALVDGTPGGVIAAAGDAFVRGPRDLAAMAAFLEADVLPNVHMLGEKAASSRTSTRNAPDAVVPFLGPPSLAAAEGETARPPVFVATNGIGLGHAQRAALVAREFAGEPKPVFAAFPSCMGLVKSYGFDVMPLIGRSALHAQRFENDLGNYVRLKALTRDARTLVFDGGYVFDSIYRTILENRLSGVWIRRGLWQATQNNTVALDREKAFERVIVPREAFDELNRPYSQSAKVSEVGPIVHRAALAAGERARLREGLAERYGLAFEHLVVTLLGGGVVADRTTQIQALCGISERRAGTLHLVVLWPGGRQEAGWFGWRRTRVVRTQHAGALVAAADLCVAASGYNLFHEVLYNRTPAIFVPQMGPFMDDQAARARAAAERGLAAIVEPADLMRLDREVLRLLDRGEGEIVSRRMAAAQLPEPGNAAAAGIIAEVNDGEERLRGNGVTRMSAGGRQS